MKGWKHLLYMHKNDRIACGFVVGVAVAATLAIYLADGSGEPLPTAPTTPSPAATTSGAEDRATGGTAPPEAELFPFDPNTADSAALRRLGLSRWMIRNIYRYRAAGGVYSKPSDFARLYGLTKKQYETLLPYIRIAADYRVASEFYGNERPDHGSADAAARASAYVPRDTTQYPVKLRPGEHIALNTSDTTQLKKVPGIGSSYARALVRRRERLGGFYSVAQLQEIDGFPTEALAYFSVSPAAIRKLNLNKSTYSQLRQHPYINFYQARDIIDYRRLHGKLTSTSQLRLFKSFTPADIERLSHYIEF